MHTMRSREIFPKKCRQQQIFDSDLKGAWHYNHVTFTPIAQNFKLYCRLIYMLSILCVRLTIKVKVGIPESFKVGWYPLKKTGSRHLKRPICDERSAPFAVHCPPWDPSKIDRKDGVLLTALNFRKKIVSPDKRKHIAEVSNFSVTSCLLEILKIELTTPPPPPPPTL